MQRFRKRACQRVLSLERQCSCEIVVQLKHAAVLPQEGWALLLETFLVPRGGGVCHTGMPYAKIYRGGTPVLKNNRSLYGLITVALLI